MPPKRDLTLWAAQAVLILNLLDAIFTLLYAKSGIATEGNPIMERFLASGSAVFMAAKLTLASGCVWLLWQRRNRPLATIGLVGAAAVYVLLVGYHVSAMPLLVAQL